MTLKSIVGKGRKFFRKVKKKLINKKNPRFYADKARALQETNQGRLAKQMLDEGLSFYPNSLLIHREYALFTMRNKFWKQAAKHWNKVFKSTNEHLLYETDYLKASNTYLELNLIDKSINVLKKGFLKHPDNITFLKHLAESSIKAKYWNEAVHYYTLFFEKESVAISSDIILGLAEAYEQLGEMNRAEYIIREAVNVTPQNQELVHRYAQFAIKRQQWRMAIQRYEHLLNLYGSDEKQSTETTLTLSMLYQLIGERDHADELLGYISNLESEKNDEAYDKIKIFENDGCTIDFYKKFKSNKQVIITFDSRDVDWNEPPFGFKLLLRQDVDIIAVRQKAKRTYQQSLSQEEFMNAVETLVNGYDDKLAYGHSLGGYTSLYFAANLNCRILSLAPRISIHPVYGKPSTRAQYDFKHKLAHNYNDTISPIIAYDPKEIMDHRYVNEVLLPAYPNAILIKLPYSGHGVARHLLRMGVLKEFILTVLAGEVPKYNRKLKGQSANYCRVLGKECLKRGKLSWAKNLSNRSLELLPNDRHGVKLKLDVLKATDGDIAALDYISRKVEEFPKRLSYCIIMIDHYIKMEDLMNAEFILSRALATFQESESLLNRKTSIEQKRIEILNRPIDF